MTNNKKFKHGSPPLVSGYKILEEIGVGGYGIVYLAEEDSYNAQRVAIKVFSPHPWGEEKDIALQRHKDESFSLSVLRHQNVVTYITSGFTKDTDQPYIVMRYVAGGNLQDLRSELSIRDMVHVLIDVLDGLDYCHKKKKMHRDVNPKNIIVEDGRGVLVDFGLAYAFERKISTMTKEAIGTPGYIAPELYEDFNDRDYSLDIYGVGATLYFCATGKPPVKFDSSDPPSSKNNKVGFAFDAIVKKALSDKQHRYKTARDMKLELERWLEDREDEERAIDANPRIADIKKKIREQKQRKKEESDRKRRQQNLQSEIWLRKMRPVYRKLHPKIQEYYEGLKEEFPEMKFIEKGEETDDVTEKLLRPDVDSLNQICGITGRCRKTLWFATTSAQYLKENYQKKVPLVNLPTESTRKHVRHSGSKIINQRYPTRRMHPAIVLATTTDRMKLVDFPLIIFLASLHTVISDDSHVELYFQRGKRGVAEKADSLDQISDNANYIIEDFITGSI